MIISDFEEMVTKLLCVPQPCDGQYHKAMVRADGPVRLPCEVLDLWWFSS